MNSGDQNKINEPCCSEGGDCPPENTGSPIIKTIIFAIVIILAMGVTSYSLFFKKDASAPACVPGETPKALEELSTVPGLKEQLTDLDFAILVFTDTFDEIPTELSATIEGASSVFQAKTPGMETFILSPEDQYYDEAVDHYVITGFPAVLALGRYGNKLLVRSGITDSKLVAAYNETSNPLACCPK